MLCLKQLVFSSKSFHTYHKMHSGSALFNLRSLGFPTFAPSQSISLQAWHIQTSFAIPTVLSHCFHVYFPSCHQPLSSLFSRRKTNKSSRTRLYKHGLAPLFFLSSSFFTQTVLLPIFLSKRHNHDPFTNTKFSPCCSFLLMFNFLKWKQGGGGVYTLDSMIYLIVNVPKRYCHKCMYFISFLFLIDA